MSRSGKSMAHPLPSPSANEASITGFKPKISKIMLATGSRLRCEAIIYSLQRGLIKYASKAATSEITPSITTGNLYILPPIKIPVSVAISSPPKDESKSSTAKTLTLLSSDFILSKKSLSLKPYFSIPSFIVSIFLFNLISSSPAPRPVTSSTGKLSMAAESADDVVVFPIPISPVPIILFLLSFSSLTMPIPVRSALSVISSGIAFSFIKLFVPCINL